MFYIIKDQFYEDLMMERDLIDFVDDMEKFQSRHKKKNDILGKKFVKKELYGLNKANLILLLYNLTKHEIVHDLHRLYFNSLKHYDKKKLIHEILKREKYNTDLLKKKSKGKYKKRF
ncbi:MAG: hypothetical protein ACTSWX_00100 [Promethearchaeota archaeon]